jgi:hemerythrin
VAVFEWKDSYRTGIAKIDAQHRKLVDFLNERYDAMKAGKGRDALEQVFQGLIDYTRSHFATEESLMRRHRYPDYDDHREIHRRLTRQAHVLRGKFQEGTISSPIQITNFLKDWLGKHILGTDPKVAAYLRGKGVA